MSRPRVFYFCYDQDQPTGGQKHTYQHVDILNRSGFDAFVLHRQVNYRLRWFDNDTRVIDFDRFSRVFNEGTDFLVLPEDLGSRIARFPGKRKIVFNKNIYYGDRSEASDDPYLCAGVIAVFCVSRHNYDVLKFTYPELTIAVVDLNIRPERFTFRPLSEKTPRIACGPKAKQHTRLLKSVLDARALRLPGTRSCSWVFAHDLQEAQVSKLLSESLIFVHLCSDEGLGRFPLEAMASGCVVAAYRHGALKEYLPPEYGFEQGDLLGVAKYIEGTLRADPGELAERQCIADRARAVALKYDDARQAASVLQAWDAVLHSSASNVIAGGP